MPTSWISSLLVVPTRRAADKQEIQRSDSIFKLCNMKWRQSNDQVESREDMKSHVQGPTLSSLLQFSCLNTGESQVLLWCRMLPF